MKEAESAPPLTHRQKQLLVQLVQLGREARLAEVITPIPYDAHRYVILVRGQDSFVIDHIADLDALCRTQALGYKLSRMGNAKQYVLTKASFRLAKLWQAEQQEDALPDWMRLSSEAFTAAQRNTRQAICHELQEALASLLPPTEHAAVVDQLTELTNSTLPNPTTLRAIGQTLLNSFTPDHGRFFALYAQLIDTMR